MKVSIEVIDHPSSNSHRIYKVYNNGRVYAISCAAPFPAEGDMLKYFKTDRRDFRPFDESTNTYLD